MNKSVVETDQTPSAEADKTRNDKQVWKSGKPYPVAPDYQTPIEKAGADKSAQRYETLTTSEYVYVKDMEGNRIIESYRHDGNDEQKRAAKASAQATCRQLNERRWRESQSKSAHTSKSGILDRTMRPYRCKVHGGFEVGDSTSGSKNKAIQKTNTDSSVSTATAPKVSSESAHTKGPWYLTPKLSASENHKGFTISEYDKAWIADVSPRDEDGNGGEANARLIAAASELLEACKKALAAIKANETHIVWRELENAIAKAEGKHS
jgi:hypothetical protein